MPFGSVAEGVKSEVGEGHTVVDAETANMEIGSRSAIGGQCTARGLHPLTPRWGRKQRVQGVRVDDDGAEHSSFKNRSLTVVTSQT
jgi:hypothetical protein